MESTDLADFTRALEAIERRNSERQFYRLFPAADLALPSGSVIHARSKYAKHLEFFEAGAKYRERCFMAANRVGKTLGAGGYETAAHLTGEYPHWWPGRRFTKPVKWWAAGKISETTRDIVQATLLGQVTRDGRKRFDGTGIIPGHRGALNRRAADIAVRNGGGGHSGARGAGRAGAVGILKMNRHSAPKVG